MNDVQLNFNNIKTTPLGLSRIKKNLNLKNENILNYCKKIIMNNNCNIHRKGKNWYCELDNIIITINSNSYTIITAHIKK